MSLEETKKKGIVGSFEDRYADVVKVYTIADKDGNVPDNTGNKGT